MADSFQRTIYFRCGFNESDEGETEIEQQQQQQNLDLSLSVLAQEDVDCSEERRHRFCEHTIW